MNKNLPVKVLTQTEGTQATMYLYGYIGQDYEWIESRKEETITDVAVLKALRDFEKDGVKTVHIRINSPGGSALHMDGIISLMQSSKLEVHTWVDGMAASAAADIFLAAKKEFRHMAKNAKIMIHDARIGTYGNAKKLRTAAETLDKFTETAIAQMASDTGMSETEIQEKYYDGEDHWFTAKECAGLGFITAVENFDAEKMPDGIEKMNQADLIKLFEPQEVSNNNHLFKRLFPGFYKLKPVEVKNTLDMNVEDFKKDFGTDQLPEKNVVDFLKTQGYEINKTTPPPTTPEPSTDIAKAIQDGIAAATQSLNDQVKSLQAEIKKFGDNPATPGPSGNVTPNDPASGAQGGADKTVEEEVAELNEADGYGSPFKAHVF